MRQECHLDARGCVGSTSRHFLLYDWATIALRFLVIVRAAIAAEILRRGEILRGIGRAVPLELREVQIAGGGHASSPSSRIAAVNSFARSSSVRFPQCASACSLVHGPRQPAQNIPLLSSTKPHILIAITRPSFGNCAPSASTDSAPVTCASSGNCAPLARTYSAPVTCASFGNCAPSARTDSAPALTSAGNCAPSASTYSAPA